MYRGMPGYYLKVIRDAKNKHSYEKSYPGSPGLKYDKVFWLAVSNAPKYPLASKC